MSTDLTLLAHAVSPLLYWYDANKRDLPWRNDPTPYHVWISEIMLQQTRVEAVKPYYTAFLAACPTPKALSEISDDRLMKLWEGLGYYSRARNLKKAAIIIENDYQGELPRDYGALLSLPGIGKYTAGAIASIAMGMPIPAIDGNVLRVLTRLLASWEDITKDKTKDLLFSLLSAVYPTSPDEASAMTQALMELGATVCIPNGAPLCDKCPLKELCRARKDSLIDQIPQRPAKKPRRIETLTVLVLLCDGKYAIRKRKDGGLLSGLYELPNLPGHLHPDAIPALSGAKEIVSLGAARHIFTHVEWEMIGYAALLDSPLPEYEWKTPAQIRADHAIASAFRAYVKEIRSREQLEEES